ncbi:MAG TPA: c-type cytochrome [Opitutaceae bacterium]|jgi:cytochrome c553
MRNHRLSVFVVIPIAAILLSAPLARAQQARTVAAPPEPTLPEQVALAPIDVPAWAYPSAGNDGNSPSPGGTLVSVPRSKAHYTLAQVGDPFSPPDWHPEAHPPMPEIVAHGRQPNLWSCAFCHLPDGSGRPENAALTGLPASYIVQQVSDFRSGARRSASGSDDPLTRYMRQMALNATQGDVAAAAAYFSGLRMPSKVTVIETARIPMTRAEDFIYAVESDATPDLLGARIIEVAADMKRHKVRDSGVAYIAYVPVGSIERGRRIATAGPDGPATSCFACHGADLKGTAVAPPLAGHFATYILRQLFAFRNGARAGPAAVLMHPVVAKLTLDDMIAVAAFAASRSP